MPVLRIRPSVWLVSGNVITVVPFGQYRTNAAHQIAIEMECRSAVLCLRSGRSQEGRRFFLPVNATAEFANRGSRAKTDSKSLEAFLQAPTTSFGSA